MPSSTDNVKLGVCSVEFNAADLGFTKGGVSVSVETSTKEVMVDQFGETPIDEIIMGRKVSVTVPLAETTLENLVATMPGATLITDGVDPLKKKVEISTGVSTSLLSLAQKLVLRPVNTSGEDDFTVLKAMTGGNLQFAYNFDNERVFNVTFSGYADASGLLCVVGDETASA